MSIINSICAQGFCFFSAVIYNLMVSFPMRGFFCGTRTIPGWVGGGAESEETLKSIGLLLFPAPNKSQESLTGNICVLCCGFRFGTCCLAERQCHWSNPLMLPQCLFMQTVTSDIRRDHHLCETKRLKETLLFALWNVGGEVNNLVWFTLNNNDGTLLGSSHSHALRLSDCFISRLMSLGAVCLPGSQL